MKIYKLTYFIAIFIFVCGVWIIRSKLSAKVKVMISGETMGTTYNISYLHKKGKNYKAEIDSLLEVWNKSLSTYMPESEISYFNSHDTLIFQSGYFLPVLLKSREVYEATEGAFDPTVMPLVNAWGFGPEKQPMPDSARIDSLLNFVGFDKVAFDSKAVWKKVHGVKLDFNAIAQGYASDVVGDFLQSKGIMNYIIEIGGEVVSKGKNDKGRPWSTGIEDPKDDLTYRRITAIVELKDRAISTSGNYRNFYVKNGHKYSHEISPFTGYPAEQNLLSASVIADDCITADAFATGFMVLGLDNSKRVLERRKDLDVYFIYEDSDGIMNVFMTDGVKKILKTE